jgi:hypothetical protein
MYAQLGGSLGRAASIFPSQLSADVQAINAALAADWPMLAGKRIFMTGGTGFIGRWMLSALADANARFGLGVEIDVLTRNPDAFAKRETELASAFAGTCCPWPLAASAMTSCCTPRPTPARTSTTTIR